MAHNPKLSVVSVPSLGYGSLTVNVGSGPRAQGPMGQDPRVRLAFDLSLDRAALNSVVFAGLYTPNAQATSAVSPLYDTTVPIPPRDLVRAKALLKEAGVTTPLPVDLVVYNTPQAVQAGEVIQAMASEAGFNVHVNTMEFGTALATVIRGDYQVTLGGWSGLLDTDSNAWSFLHTDGKLNWAHYSNPKVDALLDQARVESDVGARRALYSKVWQQVNTDLPLIYLLDDAQHPGRVAPDRRVHPAGGRAAPAAGRPRQDRRPVETPVRRIGESYPPDEGPVSGWRSQSSNAAWNRAGAWICGAWPRSGNSISRAWGICAAAAFPSAG